MSSARKHIKCSICDENEALIFIKLLGEKGLEEKGLCAPCAIRYMQGNDMQHDITSLDKRIMEALEEMRGLLGAIVTNIGAISTMNQMKQNTLACPHCGLTYDQFKQSGYLACPECYHAFRHELSEILLEIERGLKHKGRYPERFQKIRTLVEKIRSLEVKLKSVIQTENYEEAGKIQKQLEKLTGQKNHHALD